MDGFLYQFVRPLTGLGSQLAGLSLLIGADVDFHDFQRTDERDAC